MTIEMGRMSFNELVLRVASERMVRAPFVETGEDNVAIFIKELSDSIKSTGKEKVHIAFAGGPVPAGKTVTTFEVLLPLLFDEMNKAGIDTDNLEVISRDDYEDIVGQKLKSQLIKIIGNKKLNNIKTRKELSNSIDEIEVINPTDLNKDFKDLLSAYYRFLIRVDGIDEEKDPNSDIKIIKSLLFSIPGRFLGLDDKHKLDDTTFLHLVGTEVVETLLDRLRKFEEYRVIIIDGPIGEEFGYIINSRFYLTRVLTEVSNNRGEFEKFKENYRTFFVGLTADPKIYIGAIGRHAIHKAKTLKEAQDIALKCDLQIPRNKQEWSIAGSGASFKTMQLVFKEQIRILQRVGLGELDPTLKVITEWDNKSDEEKVKIENELKEADAAYFRQVSNNKTTKNIIEILLEARNVALKIDKNEPPKVMPLVIETAWRLLVGKLLEKIALENVNLSDYVIAYNNPYINLNKVKREEILEIRERYDI